MESRAKLFGHPAHQALVAFPVGLLATSVVFDFLALLGAGPSMSVVAYWTLTAGLVGGLDAAPFGVVDLMAIPKGTRAHRIGRLHGGGNFIVLWLFIASWALRPDDTGPAAPLPFVLSVCGVLLTLMTAWLGGELVSRLGVGVSANAHLDASSSLNGPRDNGRVSPVAEAGARVRP